MIVTVCTGVGRDEEVFADGKVQHIGQIIGIIVAESQPLAQRAAKAVCITYEDLPSIITIEVCKIINSQFNNQFRQWSMYTAIGCN